MNEAYLFEKLGSMVQVGLLDDEVFEIMLNPDGRLWFKKKWQGNVLIGEIDEIQASSFVNALSNFKDKYINHESPYLDTTLPFNGERVNITVPPITERTSFNIRKKSKIIFTLNNYVESKIISEHQADVLKQAIIDRKNILVSGSPASGKTTLTNALLHTLAQVAPEGHRVVILEQIPELQCTVANQKSMVVSDHVNMNKLLWITMRNSPDRIIVGEVRDGAALDLLKAWNTGCPGGIATIHANNPRACVQRILDLACETISDPPYTLAAETLNIIVQIEECLSHPSKRLVTHIVEVVDFDLATKIFHFKRLGINK